MNRLGPALPYFLIMRSAGKLEPRAVEMGTKVIGVREPNQHGHTVENGAEALFAFAKCLLDVLVLAGIYG